MTTWQVEQANLSASTTTANLLAGEIVEFTPVLSLVTVWAVSSAGNVNMQLYADSDIVVDDKEIIYIGTSLIDKDHQVAAFYAAPNTRIVLRLRETGGAATTDVLLKVTVEAA